MHANQFVNIRQHPRNEEGVQMLRADDVRLIETKNCNIQEGSCTQNLLGRKITLDIHPKPVKAMKELIFRVTITGRKLSSNPYIDLGMPGMNMGPNRVHLKRVGKRVYEGAGVIVRCSSGRRTWRAMVTLPDFGEAMFIFDVIY